MIKAVVFDCFGVLNKDMWVEFCNSLPRGDVVDTARALNHQYDAGKISLDEFLDGVSQASGRDRETIKKIFDHPPVNKNLRLLEYIGELKKGYKIGMISNIATNWVREDFLNVDEQGLFDDMTFSYEAGATKPEPSIYRLALRKLGVEPSQAVFIDDQPRYCDGAIAIGMQAIAYKDFDQMKAELEKILADNSGSDN